MKMHKMTVVYDPYNGVPVADGRLREAVDHELLTADIQPVYWRVGNEHIITILLTLVATDRIPVDSIEFHIAEKSGEVHLLPHDKTGSFDPTHENDKFNDMGKILMNIQLEYLRASFSHDEA